MHRRDLSKALFASVSGAALLHNTAAAQSCTAPCYPATPSETNMSLNTSYPPGDLRRYGADTSGQTDSTTAINNACRSNGGDTGVVLHPGGTIRHDSTIIVPNRITIAGTSRSNCTFNYTGTGSAWRNINPPPSGYALVNFVGIAISTANTANTGAALELNAGGWSYYEIHDCWLKGAFQYGLILDAVELCFVHDNIIDLSGPADPYPFCIWIVNGPDRTPGQTTGFSNVITIRDNQLSSTGGYGLADDGGNAHTVTGNNFNGQKSQGRFAGVNSLALMGNSFESQPPVPLAAFNVELTNVGIVSGQSKGACTNGIIQANTFAGNMHAGSCLVTAGTFHTGFTITGNYFQSVLGRGAAIDASNLASSYVGQNFDNGLGDMFHYTGVHDDANGNTLLPPQNWAAPPLNISGATYGDTRYPNLFYGGIGVGAPATPAAIPGVAQVYVDSADGGLKVVFANGTVRTLAQP